MLVLDRVSPVGDDVPGDGNRGDPVLAGSAFRTARRGRQPDQPADEDQERAERS